MGTHFTAVDGVHLAHLFLDEGMAGFTLHGFTTISFNNSLGIPDQSRVMDDLAAGIPLQEGLGEQAYYVVALDKTTFFIKEKTAVKIAVPGNGYIGSGLQEPVFSRLTIFRQQWVGNAVGEVAVGLMKHMNKLKRQVFLQ